MASREGRPLTHLKGHPGATLLMRGEEHLRKKENPRVDRPHRVLTIIINTIRGTKRFDSSRKRKKKNTEQPGGASGVVKKGT